MAKPLIQENQKEEFTELVYSGWTIPQLMLKYSCSRSAIAGAKKRWDLVGKSPHAQKVDSVNKTKHCYVCGTTKPINDFYSNGKTPNGSQKFKPTCKICENKSYKDSAVEHLFNLLKELNMKYSCLDCGISGPYGLLDFHHRNPKEKSFTVGRELSGSYSYNVFKKKLEKEILKCDILCPTCHRRRHIL